MINPLEMAVARIQQLPEAEQERVARFVLHELDEDAAWLRLSESHTDALEKLAADIMAEDANGECPDLGLDDL
jgi:hypothetical protein